jgi:hypothetical protein
MRLQGNTGKFSGVQGEEGTVLKNERVRKTLGISLWLLIQLNRSLYCQQPENDWSIVAAPSSNPNVTAALNSAPTWKVTQQGGNAVATPFTREDREQLSHIPLPPHFVRQTTMLGNASALRVVDGWLIGFDGGEFEGGLWSTNEDGSQTKALLSNVDIHAMFQTTKGVVVLEGLAHIASDKGSAFFVPASSWASSAATKIADLHSSPEASVQESPDTLLIATNKAVLRLNAAGLLTTLFEQPNGFLGPRSILSTDRQIYVGMRGYVLRLHPSSTGYLSQWLIPN